MLQALAALNIYLGGSKELSKNAVEEWLCNLTYHALTNENDKIIMQFAKIGEFVLKILEELAKIELNVINETIDANEILNEKLNETVYEFENTP